MTAVAAPVLAPPVSGFLDSVQMVMMRPEFSLTRSVALPGEIFLQVPVKLLSQNTGYNAHWSVKARHRADMDLIARLITKGLHPGLLRAEGPRLVLFYSRGRADLSNIVGGGKGLIDALVKLRVFKDDCPKDLVFVGAYKAPKHTDPDIQATIYIGDVA